MKNAKPCFHIQHAGTPEAAFDRAKWHPGQRARGPHGVGVAERQHLPLFLAAGQVELAPQVSAAQLAHARHGRQAFGQQLIEAPDAVRIAARRFAFHQFADQGHGFGQTIRCVGE